MVFMAYEHTRHGYRLASITYYDHVNAYTKFIEDASVQTRRRAVQALGRTGTPVVIPHLLGRLNKEKGSRNREEEDDQPVRRSIVEALGRFIGKYLSRLRKLHQVIAPKKGFEAQLRAARVPITFGMSALGMTSQIHEGRLYRVIEPGHVPGLQGLDNPA